MLHLLRALYEHDIAEEDALLQWHKSLATATGPLLKIREAVFHL
jgi:hypothetical protein